MSNAMMSISGTLVLLLAVGVVIGLLDRRHFGWRWLFVALALVLFNDLALTRAYGLMPQVLPEATLNWQGKFLALGLSLLIAAHPAFGWRRVGLTLAHEPGSLHSAGPIALLYVTFFLALAFAFVGEPASREDIAFQLTMPGLEEEIFYRGILLFALDRAFTGRVRFLGIDWGWGAVLSSALFGLTHAFGYSSGGFTFDAMTMALTGIPSFLAVWVRVRTGSLLLPILMHNAGNTLMTAV